jgi:hypothetical protein
LRIRIHFIRIRIQIQHFRLNTDLDPIQIQGFNDQKLEKITAEKKLNFLDQNYILPTPRPPSRTSKLLKIFLLLWVIFALLDPDPLTRLNPDPDTDPQPCHLGQTELPDYPGSLSHVSTTLIAKDSFLNSVLAFCKAMVFAPATRRVLASLIFTHHREQCLVFLAWIEIVKPGSSSTTQDGIKLLMY